MCERCGWKALVETVGKAIDEKPKGLDDRKQEWLEAIRVTVDDDRHATDRQKGVVRSMLKQAGSKFVKKVPRAMDRTKWSDKKKEAVRQTRRRGREYDRYGKF